MFTVQLPVASRTGLAITPLVPWSPGAAQATFRLDDANFTDGSTLITGWIYASFDQGQTWQAVAGPVSWVGGPPSGKGRFLGWGPGPGGPPPDLLKFHAEIAGTVNIGVSSQVQ